jgi:uncharacterized protein (DUF1501 family)
MNRMIHPTSRPVHCPGPIGRRSLLSAGAAAFTGLGLADLLRLQAQAANKAPAANDKSVIFVWLPGGPPHMETFDMKPDAPEDYRGAFRPIHTNVPGIDICEHLPLLAKRADKYTLIRSVAHDFADHGGGHKRFMTGRDPKEPTGFVNDYPAVGSMIAKSLEKRNVGVPNYVLEVDAGRQNLDTFSLGAAYLGSATAPFVVAGDPSDKGFAIQNLSLAKEMETRLDDRGSLLAGLDRLQRNIDGSGSLAAMDSFNQRAIDLLTSAKARAAFDISQEKSALRESYGDHAWGQRAIMARRLVESGVKFVTVVMENPYGKQIRYMKNGTYNWDSHAVNCHLFDDALVRLPLFDRTIAALLDDLYARGLEKDVLLVVTGEFGRTPRISHQVGSQSGVMQPGRDHWPGAMSMLVSGGGMRTGQVVGATSTKGEYPVDRPLTPNDLWATVFRHLGIDYNQSLLDHQGRPMPMLPFGEPIRELT